MSGFTALNGSSPKPGAKPTNGATSPSSRNGTAEEQPSKASPATPAQTSASAAEAAPASTTEAVSPLAPDSHVEEPVDDATDTIVVDALVEAPVAVEDPDSPATEPAPPVEVPAESPAAADAEPSAEHEDWAEQAESATVAETDPDSKPASTATNKRKRSASNDGRSQLPTKRMSEPVRRAPTPDNSQHGEQPETHHSDQSTQDRDRWYAQQAQEVARQAGARTSSPQYEPDSVPSVPITAASAPGQQEYVPITPQSNNRAAQYQNASYSDPRPSGVIQLDPKKRKRNFSNRTKTGCLTCRRRKKKCDEGKPECNNCIKGAFVCAGYPPQRGAAGWPKAVENKPGGVPLESKDPNYVPPGAYGMPTSPYNAAQANHAVSNNGQPSHPPAAAGNGKREPLPQYRGQSLRIDPSKNQGGPARDDRMPASATPNGNITSPEHKLPPAFGDGHGNDYPRGPHEAHTPHQGHMQQAGMHHPADSPTPHPSAGPSAAQMAAQMALAQSHPQNAVVPYDQRRPTQKEEMLGGGYFYQFDKELCMERERAATACWRFNSLTSPPVNGVSAEERSRLFLEILQPRETAHFPPAEASPRSNVGRVGRHVSVETPFYCDYGYNITIGNHVLIGRNCTLNDAARIQIGDNTIIGPNVSIYTVELSTDPKHRQGGQGAQLGKGVIIDSDCWIGGGAIIMPGKVVGKGATVGAGSVVTKDVPPFTVVAGNPARVLRGVASL